MTIPVRPGVSHSYGATLRPAGTPPIIAKNTRAVDFSGETLGFGTVEVTIEKGALSLDGWAAKGLSSEDLKQVESIYKRIYTSPSFARDFSTLLEELVDTGEYKGFLNLVFHSGPEVEEFVDQAYRLDGESRSLFLRIAGRLKPGPGSEHLEQLSAIVKKSTPESMDDFLNVASQLDQDKTDSGTENLKNFISAAAGSPSDISALSERTEALNEQDGEMAAGFLKAAAVAGRELGQLMRTADSLKGDPMDFFRTAAVAGEELKNFLIHIPALDMEEQNEFLTFTARLSTSGKTDTENFLHAIWEQGVDRTDLMDASEKLDGEDNSALLQLAASGRVPLERLTSMLNKPRLETRDVSNFLSAAVKSMDRLSGFLNIAEKSSGKDLTELLTFSADLSYIDLAGFIPAADRAGADTHGLIQTARDLTGHQKSLFLYAAATEHADTDRLIDLTGALNGKDLDSFLLTAANLGGEINAYLEETGKLDGEERRDYIAFRKESLDPTNAIKHKYVFLKSVFTEKTFEAILGNNENAHAMDALLKKLGAMDESRLDGFNRLAEKAGDEARIPELLSIVQKFSADDFNAVVAASDRLQGESLSSFLVVLDNIKTPSDPEDETLSIVLDTAKKLPAGASFLETMYTRARISGKSLNLNPIDWTDPKKKRALLMSEGYDQTHRFRRYSIYG